MPQRLRGHFNGIALSISRRGVTGRRNWSTHYSLGSGHHLQPYCPNTQGRTGGFLPDPVPYLDQQRSLAASIAELQGSRSDRFDLVHNTQRPTRACLSASPTSRPGTPPRWPRHRRTTTPRPIHPRRPGPSAEHHRARRRVRRRNSHRCHRTARARPSATTAPSHPAASFLVNHLALHGHHDLGHQLSSSPSPTPTAAVLINTPGRPKAPPSPPPTDPPMTTQRGGRV